MLIEAYSKATYKLNIIKKLHWAKKRRRKTREGKEEEMGRRNGKKSKVKRRDYGKGTRHEIMTLTLACGCLPYKRLALMGLNTRTVRKKIHEMCDEGVMEIYHKNEVWLAGIKDYAEKKAEYEKGIESKLHRYYMQYGMSDYKRAKYSAENDGTRIIKNAESYMFMYGSGLNCMLGEKVSLRNQKEMDYEKLRNSYYTAREIKGYDSYTDEKSTDNVISATRVNGLVISDGGSYPVYHTGSNIQKYTRSGEKKMEVYINRMLAKKKKAPIKGAVILATDLKAYINTIIPKTRQVMEVLSHMEGVYEHVYGLNLDVDGQKMMRLLSTANWDSMIYKEMLGQKWMPNKTGVIDCDGQENGIYYFCYCVPDIKRFKLFLRRAELDGNRDKYRILCFDTQEALIKEVAGQYTRIFTTSFSEFCKAHSLTAKGASE